MYEIQQCFPTLFEKNVPVPPALPHNGWWNASSEFDGEVRSVRPTWSGQADELIRNGSIRETAYHYPAGGFRPGNNEPDFFDRFVPAMGGNQLCIPHQEASPFDPQPFDGR